MEGRRHTGATRRRTSDLRLESIPAARLHVDPTASRNFVRCGSRQGASPSSLFNSDHSPEAADHECY